MILNIMRNFRKAAEKSYEGWPRVARSYIRLGCR